MSDGIKYFRDNYKCISLSGSEETEYFTRCFNDCFDALNRKYTAERIKKRSADFEVCINKLYYYYQILITNISIKKKYIFFKNKY